MFFKLPRLIIFTCERLFFKWRLLGLTLSTSRLEAFEELPSQSKSDYILNRLQAEQLQRYNYYYQQLCTLGIQIYVHIS